MQSLLIICHLKDALAPKIPCQSEGCLSKGILRIGMDWNNLNLPGNLKSRVNCKYVNLSYLCTQ